MGLEEEFWKDIEGFEGYYQVSAAGEVSSLPRLINYVDGRKKLLDGILLKQCLDDSGYPYVTLCKDGKRFAVRTHTLVATHFIDKKLPCLEVNHLDECKTNNKVDNLEWVSHIQNMRYGTGRKRSATKLSKPVKQLSLNGEFVKLWTCGHEITRTLGYSCASVGKVCAGKQKTAYGFIWRFA